MRDAVTKEIMVPPDQLDHLLQPTSTTSERVRGLLSIGLHATDLAKTVGVSASAVRNWSSGQAQPRPEAEVVLDDLRATVKILLDGGLEPARIANWLKSRHRQHFDDGRPIDAVSTTPMQVLTAAHREVLGERLTQAQGASPVRLVPSRN